MSKYNCLIGKVVQFKELIEDHETEIDGGMRAKIINITERHDDHIVIFFDTSDFMEHNRGKMKSNYYDPETMEPVPTALEAGWWPKENMHFIYFETDFEPSEYFEILGGDEKYEYVATVSGGIGEDVWDREFSVKAQDMLDAAHKFDSLVYSEYSRGGVNILEIQQK